MKKKLVIQMDKIEDIDINFDSTFLIGVEGQKRGYEIYYYNPHNLFYNNGLVQAYGFQVELIENNNNYFRYLTKKIILNLSDFKLIFVRQDPPFDMNYITSTYLLEYLSNTSIIINNPTSIRNHSEKISSFKFKEFMPPTIVSQNREIILNFLFDHKDIITKPLYGNGGEGVFRTKIEDEELVGIKKGNIILDEPLMAQKFIPEIKEGDRRIILIDGEYVGSVARMPIKDSIKANFHAGGSAKKTNLIRRDEEICNSLRVFLKENELFFVGIDIIGDYLTEINVTSPTGMKQINELNNINLEKIFWDKLEAKYILV